MKNQEFRNFLDSIGGPIELLEYRFDTQELEDQMLKHLVDTFLAHYEAMKCVGNLIYDRLEGKEGV